MLAAIMLSCAGWLSWQTHATLKYMYTGTDKIDEGGLTQCSRFQGEHEWPCTGSRIFCGPGGIYCSTCMVHNSGGKLVYDFGEATITSAWLVESAAPSVRQQQAGKNLQQLELALDDGERASGQPLSLRLRIVRLIDRVDSRPIDSEALAI
eukprot:scaffold122021_cov16-Prasinocladus_malaysianus.AAC.1